MDTTAEKLISRFDDSVPRQFQRDILKSLLSCYRDADRSVKKKYPWQEAQSVRGIVRRADIEVDLRGIADKYVGVSASPEPNKTRSWYHTKVVLGEVILTQSRTRNHRTMVKSSLFREEYAEHNPQMILPTMENPKKKVVRITKADGLFAVLTHGCRKGDKSRPAFVMVSFPDKECKVWLGAIDLLKRFPDVVEAFYAPIVAAEQEQRRVKLRKGLKIGGKEKQA